MAGRVARERRESYSMTRRRGRRHGWLWLLLAFAGTLVFAPGALAVLFAGGVAVGAILIAAVVTVVVLAAVGAALAAVAVGLFGASLAAPFLLGRWLLQALFGPRDPSRRHRESHQRPAPAVGASPEAVLRHRYAAGELTEREFRTRLVDLLKEQYVRRQIDTWEFEERLERILRNPEPESLTAEDRQLERPRMRAPRSLA